MTVTRYPARFASDDGASLYSEETGNACAPIGDRASERKALPHVCARTRYVTPGHVTLRDLPDIFNVRELHRHQLAAIDTARTAQDVVIVAPTGGGKSLGFWGAGLIRGGLTLVISPLRSLMADQHRRLSELGIPVRLWNSDVKDGYKTKTLDLLNCGWCGFLYTTPESLKGRALSRHLVGCVDLAVIDEAHCVLTERGFRVQYARLGQTLDRLQPMVRYACTATLAGHDLDRVIHFLRLREPRIITVPVARSNLSISIVERAPSELASILNRHRGESGIIFCATVATAKTLHYTLSSQGRNVTLYHGRLAARAKKQAQSDFMSGERFVAIATDAFILGIDKSNIRFVVHYDHPKDIEAWVQGFGRAGRDGLPASVYGCFLGAKEGRASREFLIESTYPSTGDLRQVWDYLQSAPFRDETASGIGDRVLGRRGKYSGSAILTTLQRHTLAVSDVHPEDRRRHLHRATGDFDQVDWSVYQSEKAQSQQRFAQLCKLVKLSDGEIPAAIDAYFARQFGTATATHGRTNED